MEIHVEILDEAGQEDGVIAGELIIAVHVQVRPYRFHVGIPDRVEQPGHVPVIHLAVAVHVAGDAPVGIDGVTLFQDSLRGDGFAIARVKGGLRGGP